MAKEEAIESMARSSRCSRTRRSASCSRTANYVLATIAGKMRRFRIRVLAGRSSHPRGVPLRPHSRAYHLPVQVNRALARTGLVKDGGPPRCPQCAQRLAFGTDRLGRTTESCGCGTGRTCRCAPPSQASWRPPLLRTLQFEVTLARPSSGSSVCVFATLAPVITLAVALPRHAASQGPRVEITRASVAPRHTRHRTHVPVRDAARRCRTAPAGAHESDCTPFFGVDVTQLAPACPA